MKKPDLPSSIKQTMEVYRHFTEVEGLDDDIASVLTLAERLNALSINISTSARRLREAVNAGYRSPV